MEEIKFRAWDNEAEKMLSPFYLWEIPDLVSRMDKEYDLKDDIFIMQFTDLTDKNGVEVYHEDIVKFDDESQEIIAIDFPRDFLWMETQQKEYEVIGNIHKNPELLKI